MISKFGFETVLQALVLKHQAQRSDSNNQNRNKFYQNPTRGHLSKPPAGHVLEQSQSASNFFATSKSPEFVNQSHLSDPRRSKTLVEMDQSNSEASSQPAKPKRNYRFTLPDPDKSLRKTSRPAYDSNSKSFISDISGIPGATFELNNDKENKMKFSNMMPDPKPEPLKVEGDKYLERDLIDSFLESDLDTVLGEFSEKDQNFEFAFN